MSQGQIIKIFLLALALSSCAPKYELRYPHERWLTDDDQRPISPPDKREEYLYWDGADNQFFYQLERLGQIPDRLQGLSHTLGMGEKVEALNVNNYDEVADSTWFENRLGRGQIGETELVRGPNNGPGPSLNGPWTVVSAKTLGKSAGFFVKDANGTKFLIKLDPLGSPELSTSADAIGAIFFHGFGYHVPQQTIVDFDPKLLVIDPKATTKNVYGEKIPFTVDQLGGVLAKTNIQPNGKIRALASKFLSGLPLGPIPYRGIRVEDINDRIPHEHRRELRGYRIFAAFLDHNDSREANTLDMFIKTSEDGRGYVKHHLIDFGNTLGSYGIGPKVSNHLHDYHLNYARILASTVALGAYQPPWKQAKTYENPAVGFFEAATFDPITWRPVYPNPAFQNMTDRDAFWATKILARLPDATITKIVAQAGYSDARVTEYIARTLIERKRKIIATWFGRMSALDDFALTDSGNDLQIRFSDLALLNLGPSAKRKYRYRLLENSSASWSEIDKPQINLPRSVFNVTNRNQKLTLQIAAQDTEGQGWSAPVDLLLVELPEPKLAALRRHSH